MTVGRMFKITSNGKTYFGEIAKIESTTLGWESHGILTAGLNCKWESGGISAGGYCLDTRESENSYSRKGTAYGLDHIMRIMETVGVTSWEGLTGQQVIVLFESESAWGMSSVGIAGLLNNKVLIFKEHATLWSGTEGTATK